MSASTDALAEALANQIEEQGQSFTVDGLDGSITGVFPPDAVQTSYGVSGAEEVPEIAFVVKRADWTPARGDVVNYQGESYTVFSIEGSVPTQWTVKAVSRQQS